ncbi:sarcosine oxidase subunit alpha family protein [Pontivivens insulae]|uniref:Sarcosine oxidase subunit alpha n=1 Tax=Pontivivens insulae TaxID=1639689 RepID=A0A2R8AEB0_9RHOB|nr:sarcosine oxidase subunit alpha family protein [Pontivivens insulae]RED11834.1 heterotetrameric sarcosine oxidase alpha subunit [Pontivivens insulae]SPF30591.1 Sarcosine oxidase subunit alpha [Pontivivens insulae]
MRVREGSRIDAERVVRFSLNGKAVVGRKGDTLASALLANDQRLMGRSFKYHRPRGVVTAGSEEPNALFEIGTGAGQVPNVRGTVQEIFDGMVARSQNCWPSLERDALAINDLMSRFLSAGFYYKTFMWPQAFWEKLYEPIIRRAAGLGALSGDEPVGDFDKAWAHCDLLIIGGGPAGLMAALTAGRTGQRVLIADEDVRLGGRLDAESFELGGMASTDWAREAAAELDSLPNVRVMTRTTVTGAYDGRTFGAYERVSEHLASPPAGAPVGTFWRIVADRTLLAGGAHERMIAFPDNDRPGIMQASAVRSYLHRYGVAPGRKVAVFTNNDDGWRTVDDLQAAGVEVSALIDTRPDVEPGRDVRTVTGAQVVATRGRLGLESLDISKPGGGRQFISADCLAVSGGWNPSVHLTCHMNGRPIWRDDIAAFVPKPGAVPGLEAIGAANGAFSTHEALRAGADAAGGGEIPAAEDAPVNVTPFWHVTGVKGRQWLDLQNDVTVKDIKLAHQENFRSVEHMKRYTTLGMATDQGKLSNMGGLAVMAELTGQPIPSVGTTTFRPPYTPIPVAALAGRAHRAHFAPDRYTPSHQLSEERGASYVEAGLWHRAAWFPQGNETTWKQSADREVGWVRGAVGVCDVTTLGKIDVQGPGARDLLDLLYTGKMSTLKEGRVRYGLMLREDGFVMDDGTCARLGPDHYVITTTTAAAGEVMAYMDFCAQVLKPDLPVRFISTTEQWAQFAVAGPQSRALLEGLLDQGLNDDVLPFMGYLPVQIGDVAGRLFRISFSGELAYELAVPTRYGDALIRVLEDRAKALGGGLYGMEALNILRIEKGFITHSEIHGRVTADDIGFGRMVSPAKDCIGKVMSQRPGLHGAERQQLVGLRAKDGALKAGAHIFGQGKRASAENDQGYITSACTSPTLGHLALAFVVNGRARHGEQVVAHDGLHGTDIACEIVDPVFMDPDGEKMRG